MKRGGLLQGLVTAGVVMGLSVPLRSLGPDYWFIFSLAGLSALAYGLTGKLLEWSTARGTRGT